MQHPKYEHLQTTAFHIAEPALLNRSYSLLRFPAKWKTPLLKLAARPDQDTPRIPIKSLNRTLIALIPDIVQVATYATRGQDPIWIVSDRRVPPQAIFAIIAAWVRTQGWRNPDVLEQTLAAMDGSDLHWEEFRVDYAAQLRLVDATDQRVREQARTVVFKLLPHELAARLSRPGLLCDHGGNETSAFRRCPSPSGEGSEIMSWPPHGQADRPFSFTVHLSAETLPFGSEARIYTHFGVRRWVHRTPSLDVNTYSAVYLNPSVPWIKRGVTYSPSFQRATLRLRVEGDRQATVRRAVWSDAFTRVLQEVNAADHVAFPESIRTEPRALLDREQGGAGLVYREGMYSFPGRPAGRHPASPGLALMDRPRLLDWVATHTAPALRLAEPLPRSPIRVLPDLHDTASRSDHDEHAGEALRTAIHAAIKQPRLRIEIYYDTQRTLDYALATLQEQLAVKFELGDTAATGPVHVHTAVRTPQLDITLRIQPVGALGAGLEPNARIRRPVERLQQAVEQRAADIEVQLPTIEPDEVAVALVEIAGKDTYKGRRREKDPKFAIRHGFNLAGRLTQFLQPVAAEEEEPGDEDLEPLDGRDQARPRSDPEAERLHSSWQDLWRQLGARPSPIPAPEGGLPPTRSLAFYVVRQNQTRTWGATRQVPIAVLMNPAGEDIQVRAPGLRNWLPLHQALRAVGRAHIMGGQTRSPQQITDFFHEVLTQELDTSQPLLLLTQAQNNRPGWTFLNNGELIADTLRFGKRAPQTISEFPGVRHVRVRTDQRNETPEGYAVRLAEKGHAGALWQVADRIWFSTADKPASARNALRYSSMVEPIEKPDGTMQPPRPGARVWNHQLVELAVAGLQASDDPGGEAWAALVHDLRWAAPHHAQPTVLPWPLHLAQLIGEYIIPIKLIEEIEASENEEAPETAVRDQLDDK
jgi:DNA segregation ATPase FtsK/SpoIIIE-like protein